MNTKKAIGFLGRNDAEVVVRDVNAMARGLPKLVESFGEDLFATLEQQDTGRAFCFVAKTPKEDLMLEAIELLLRERNKQCLSCDRKEDVIQYSGSLEWEHETSDIKVDGDASISIFSSRKGNIIFFPNNRGSFNPPAVREYLLSLDRSGKLVVSEFMWRAKSEDPKESFLAGLRWERGAEKVKTISKEDFLQYAQNKGDGYLGFINGVISRLGKRLGIDSAFEKRQEALKSSVRGLTEKLMWLNSNNGRNKIKTDQGGVAKAG